MNKLRIALLVGGTSPERAVSKSSGAAIYSALLSMGHDVVLIDPAYGLNQPKGSAGFFAPEDYTEINNANYLHSINSPMLDGVDLAFLALHGKYGEDGTIQSLLDFRGIKYTGSKVLASSVAMDKIMSKFFLIIIMFPHLSGFRWINIQLMLNHYLQ
jgi:D-alanine-D-alanine ligase